MAHKILDAVDEVKEKLTDNEYKNIYKNIVDEMNRNLDPRSVIGQEHSFPFGPSRILKGEKPDITEAGACMFIFGLLLSVIFTIISIHFDCGFPRF